MEVRSFERGAATRLSDAEAAALKAKRSVLAGAVDADLDAEALEGAVRAAEAALRQRAHQG